MSSTYSTYYYSIIEPKYPFPTSPTHNLILSKYTLYSLQNNPILKLTMDLEYGNTKNTEMKEKITTSKRTETLDDTLTELKTSLDTLGIENWDLPNTEIKFTKPEEENKLLLGHVEVYPSKPNPVTIVFDEKFSSPEQEKTFVQELQQRDLDYPGFKQTLRHELAHIAMWSVTDQERQAATRTIDEGWANLIESTTNKPPVEDVKETLKEAINTYPDKFIRALNFKEPVRYEEGLNAVESKTGQALLLWVHQEYGVDKMVELIKKSPELAKRNDDLPEGQFEPAILDEKLHKVTPRYHKLLEDIQAKNIEKEEAFAKLKELEGEQFETALLETTNSTNVEELQKEFLKWVYSN
jgi:hypothetical protein